MRRPPPDTVERAGSRSAAGLADRQRGQPIGVFQLAAAAPGFAGQFGRYRRERRSGQAVLHIGGKIEQRHRIGPGQRQPRRIEGFAGAIGPADDGAGAPGQVDARQRVVGHRHAGVAAAAEFDMDAAFDREEEEIDLAAEFAAKGLRVLGDQRLHIAAHRYRHDDQPQFAFDEQPGNDGQRLGAEPGEDLRRCLQVDRPATPFHRPAGAEADREAVEIETFDIAEPEQVAFFDHHIGPDADIEGAGQQGQADRVTGTAVDAIGADADERRVGVAGQREIGAERQLELEHLGDEIGAAHPDDDGAWADGDDAEDFEASRRGSVVGGGQCRFLH